MQVDRKLPGNTNPDCHRATLKTCQCTLKSHHGQIFPGCSHKDSPEANPMWSFHKVSKCRWAGFGGNGCFGRPTTLPNIYIKAKISCLLPAVLQEVSFPSPGFMLTPHLLPFFTTSLYPSTPLSSVTSPTPLVYYFYFPLTLLPSACHTWATDRSQHFSAGKDLSNVSELILHTPSPSP